MNKILLTLALVPVFAFANIPVRNIEETITVSDRMALFEARREPYKAVMSDCTNEDLRALVGPVKISTHSLSVREGTVFVLTDSEGRELTCTVDQVTRR